MQAFEFITKIKNGTIKIPSQHVDELNGDVRVIVMKNKIKKQKTSKIQELISNPLKIKNFKPLSRKEIYER